MARPVKDRDDPEGAIQKEVARHLRTRPMPGVFTFHVPNEGKRRNSTQHRNNGLVAGVPDWILIREGRAYTLELKRISGKLTMQQIAVHAQLRSAGVENYTAYGLSDALQWLERSGFLRPSIKAEAA